MAQNGRHKGIEMTESNADTNGGPPSVATIRKGLDANRYATKKTIAQGLLDVALLTANASQLKYVLTVGKQHDFYTAMVAMIGASIVLQLLVGVLFIVVGGLDINNPKQHRAADIINDLTLVLIFLITLINVIISSFGIQHSDLQYLSTKYNLSGLNLTSLRYPVNG